MINYVEITSGNQLKEHKVEDAWLPELRNALLELLYNEPVPADWEDDGDDDVYCTNKEIAEKLYYVICSKITGRKFIIRLSPSYYWGGRDIGMCKEPLHTFFWNIPPEDVENICKEFCK